MLTAVSLILYKNALHLFRGKNGKSSNLAKNENTTIYMNHF